ncbi:MAG TPA: helix-turn-helix domain-containing protein [Ktedonobacterales bacterium]|nr:helix-turn-helix domain-containing protein [Ktedonobacterales bacterium]
MDAEQSFGSLLKRYRRAAHMTQQALAEHAGYSSHYVSMLERGVRAPHPITVDALADALSLASPDRAALHAAQRPAREVTHSNGIDYLSALLVGRDEDSRRVLELFQQAGVRIVTLTGPGGVGKTALAQSLSAALAHFFVDGVAFMEFAAVQDADDIIPTLARGLALREMGGRSIHECLIAYLRKREMLLVLDSFERVVEGAVDVGNLVAACPHIKVLITSRVPLRLRMEREFRVQPLALPDAGRSQSLADLVECPSVGLFLQQARRTQPDLIIDDMRAGIIADICRRLDGLPLAIELAAARVAHLPLESLRDRLEHRLSILTGGMRDLPLRQQRMRDTIAWSYDLLTPEHQALLRRLAVFAPSWSLASAEEISGGEDSSARILDGVRALAESRLIIPVDDVPDEPRYRMLDTIREFATEQLTATGEVEEMRRRHASLNVRLGELAEPALQDWHQKAWYPRLEREHDNIAAALEWLLFIGDAEAALRLAGAIWRYWHRYGDIREGRRWLEASLARGQDAPMDVRVKALWGASWLAYHQGDYARGSMLSAEQLRLARELGDELNTRNALTVVGIGALAEKRYAEALLALQEALDVCVPLGNTWHRATSLLNLGAASLVVGDLARAQMLFEEAESLYEERGDDVFAARARQHLGYVLLRQGAYTDATLVFAHSLRALSDLGEPSGIADGLEAVAAVAAASAALGRAKQAAMLVAAALSLRERIGIAALPHIRAVWQPYVTRAEEQFGSADWAASCDAGAHLTVADAVTQAMTTACG